MSIAMNSFLLCLAIDIISGKKEVIAFLFEKRFKIIENRRFEIK